MNSQMRQLEQELEWVRSLYGHTITGEAAIYLVFPLSPLAYLALLAHTHPHML